MLADTVVVPRSIEHVDKETLPPIQGDRVLYQVMSRLGRNGMAGVIEGQLIHFDKLCLAYWTI